MGGNVVIQGKLNTNRAKPQEAYATAEGALLVTTVASANVAPLNATTTAYAASLVVKASAGTLYNVTGYNSKASAQFVQIFDAAALPTDGAVPAVVISVAASSPFSISFGTYGRRFENGIVICNSSTGPTKTIGAADLWIDAQYL